MSLEFTIESAINTVKKTWPKGISGGRLKEENPELYERVILEGNKGELQYARSGLKWSVLKNKYDSALEAINDLYPELSRGQLVKKNQSLYMKVKREGNLHKIPFAYKAWEKRE
ncbi:hypothetical protein KY313_03170 [Candidatus Woesearchaeota archaeon]|jgi:hypothetical protein|nr:hypothetical protein [Candidatus Woesearchaeota archaeon]